MKTSQIFRKMTALIMAAILCMTAFSGCSGALSADAPKEPSGSETKAPTERPGSTEEPVVTEDPNEGIWADKMNVVAIRKIADRMQEDDFDIRFLKYISEHTESNYMASPLSFRYALGLLLAGASGETKAELLAALGVASEEEWIEHCLNFNGFVEAFAKSLEEDIEEYEQGVKRGWIDPDSEAPFRALRVANSVWKRANILEEFEESYKESVSRNYAAEYRWFTEDNAIEKINEWANQKTENMIPELLPKDYETEGLAVVLMNALYFKDSWSNKFSDGATEEGDFHALGGKTTRKEFMQQEEHFPYYEDEETKLVILPMDGGVYMAFVIGDQEGLSEKISKASTETVRVRIPKMNLETSFSNGELVAFLKDSGVNLAFDRDNADFSAMIDHCIWIDDIIQKTRIKLDEDGVEAAAVTAIMMRDEAFIMPDKVYEFNADQPFSFYIYTTANDTTSILFAGRIVE